MIRVYNAEPGTIVWVAYGRGPKAVVIEKHDLRNKKPPWRARGIHYKVKILEDQGIWKKGTTTIIRAMMLSRTKYVDPAEKAPQ